MVSIQSKPVKLIIGLVCFIFICYYTECTKNSGLLEVLYLKLFLLGHRPK